MQENKISDIALVSIDPLLHSRVRLLAMTYLFCSNTVSFSELAKFTNSTNGNLSIQLRKLEAAGYISIVKYFTENYPATRCTITEKGKTALRAYRDQLYTVFACIS